MKLAVANLEASPRVQVRARTDAATVERYAEALLAGAVLPPIVIYREPGTERYVVADGVHRVEAAKRAGVEAIEVDLRDGDETDALEHALGCNAEHGLQRTRQDIEYAVGLLMSNAALTEKYRTHEERADVLKISASTFQRHLANWRQKEGGTKAARRAKAQARERASKHTRKTETSRVSEHNQKRFEKQPLGIGNLSRDRFVNGKVTAGALPPRPGLAVASKPPSITAETKRPPLPHGELHELFRGIGLLASSRLDMAAVAASGKVSWPQVERALDQLRALMENR